MQKRAPTLGNLLVIVLFVLSCFGLLMFLWESFGGPLPLKPKGYRFSVAFPRSFALAEESDVRISGVEVGHVVSLSLGKDGRTHATLEIAGRYAPIRASMHAILRQKTLLGETYVQLIPEGSRGPFLGDGKQLSNSQVEPSVTLDDILSAFDAKTRRDFQIWQEAAAEGTNGRGEQINAAFASLEPFAESANKLVTLLNEQEGAVKALVHNTGVVFNALASRDHQLEGSIVNGERTFHAAAEASQAVATSFRLLPAFEHDSTVALKETDKFQAIADPYFKEFQPTERQLAALLRAAKPFAPQFNSFLTAVGPLTKAAKTGLPYTKASLQLSIPVLENLRPVLHNLDPLLQYLGEYVPELQAFFANVTAASEATESSSDLPGGAPKRHVLTAMQVLTPESLAVYPSRIGTNRANAYPHSGVYGSLASGLPVFSSSACANSAPAVSGPPNEAVSEELLQLLTHPQNAGENPIANEPETANKVPAPACIKQSPFTFNGHTSEFPHAVYEGK
ncbi:MAG TPA: MlaD family protein [Solirubrobacteraceae bacterium]|jgi:phospholipid/cholesterol/gamma-HCH transport system substrate-binding protein|nr:MlaD family protein [Solirubrobacteraceae bacterium]